MTILSNKNNNYKKDLNSVDKLVNILDFITLDDSDDSDEDSTNGTGAGMREGEEEEEEETKKSDDDILQKTKEPYKDYQFQKDHVNNIVNILSKRYFCLDASETGLGKTRCAIMVAKQLGMKLFVCCPKASLSSWYRELIKADYLSNTITVTNFDVLRLGKWFDIESEVKKPTTKNNPNFWTQLKTKPCPYLKKVQISSGTSTITNFEWNLPNRILLACDEAHKAKNKKTQNAGLLIGLRKFINLQPAVGNDRRAMLLTATPIEKEKNIPFLLYLLGYLLDTKDYKKFMKNRSIASLHRLLFNKQIDGKINRYLAASRMNRETASAEFEFVPVSDVKAEIFDMPEEIKVLIEKKNNNIRRALIALNEKRLLDGIYPLVIILRNRQEIEALKVESYIYFAREKLREGLSVLIFLNFIESLLMIEKAFLGEGKYIYERDGGTVDEQGKLKKVVSLVKILGKQPSHERANCEHLFQTNKANLLLATLGAGAASISLHDVNGAYPRYSFVSMPWSCTELKQAFGRTDRVGSLSNSTYRILCCAGTIEEYVATKLNEKFVNMDLFLKGKEPEDILFKLVDT